MDIRKLIEIYLLKLLYKHKALRFEVEKPSGYIEIYFYVYFLGNIIEERRFYELELLTAPRNNIKYE